MTKIICFDMDGTIADLYSVSDWLKKLRAEDPSPYTEARPLVNMDELNEVCALLQKAGWEIQIISALSKDASPEYKKAIRKAKRAWLDKWGFVYDHFHGVDYKTPKKEVIRRDMRDGGEAILVDDEARHTNNWNWGRTIDPTMGDLIGILRNLLPQERQEEEDEIADRYTWDDLGYNWW